MTEQDLFDDDPDDLGSDRAGASLEDAGVEHLQRAAQELIAAGRAFLDIAEEVVERPDALGSLIGLVGKLGGQVARAAGTAGAPSWRDDVGPIAHDRDAGDDGPVQKIPVS